LGGDRVVRILTRLSSLLTPKKELARAAKVSHDTISKAKKIVERAAEPVKVKLRAGTQ